jgi:DNA-binding CsgD family transcriptional regulator
MRPDLEDGLWEIASTSPLVVLQRVGAAHYALAFGWRDKAAEIYSSIPLPGTARLPRFVALPVHAFHVPLGIEFEDRAAVEACYEFLLPFRELHIASGAGVVMTRGSVEIPLGQAARYLGRQADAIAHLRAGLQSNEQAGLVPLAAEACYHLAAALLDGASDEARAEATELLRAAGAAAARLQMAPLAEQVQVVRAAVSAANTEASPVDPLSKREREIAALVADGLTNRQIADAAHISERTAENHVQHILTKLGFRNRSQIAVWHTHQGG